MIVRMRNTLGLLVVVLGISLLSATIAGAQDPGVQVSLIEFDAQANRFRLTLNGIAGEFVVECSEDLQSWGALCRVGSDGLTPVAVSDPVTAARKYYRIAAIAESDGFHLEGPLATGLRSTIVYGDLQSVFGLAPAGAPALPTVLGLPSAERETRVYAATIGILSVLARQVQEGIEPSPSVAAVVAALAEDLASGALDGRSAGGARIEVGASGMFLPEFTGQDLLAAQAQLKSELGGLDNVELEPAGTGRFTPAVPASWGLFYWDSADWQ